MTEIIENREQNLCFRSRKPMKCRNCGFSPVATILYGLPKWSEQLFEDVAAGRVVIGGCIIEWTNPVWQCSKCGFQIHKAGKLWGKTVPVEMEIEIEGDNEQQYIKLEGFTLIFRRIPYACYGFGSFPSFNEEYDIMIEPSVYKWEKFSEFIRAHSNWKKRYEQGKNGIDECQWKVKLKYADFCVDSRGSNHHPLFWEEFKEELEMLLDNKL